MSKNPLIRILSSPSKAIEETRGINGVLARLWRQILADRNIRPSDWGDLMREYARRQSGNVVDQTSLRGNLAKALSKNSITWRVICKGLLLIGYREFTFTIRATDRKGRTYSHETYIALSDQHDLKDSIESGEEDEL